MSILRDIRFGFRLLAKDKRFTAVALLTLVLGIGPTIAVYTVLWSTMPSENYPHMDRVVVIWSTIKGGRAQLPAEDVLVYRNCHSFQGIEGNTGVVFNFGSPDNP